MSKVITISVPYDAYEGLRSAGEQANQSPEELAAAAIAERFRAQQPTPVAQAKQAKDAFLR